MKKMNLLFSLLFFVPIASKADSLSLRQVWDKVSGQSLSQEAAKLQVQSSQLSIDKADRHWLPRVYFDARGFKTNDPGTSFFSLLEQRSLEAADFNVASINEPDYHVYVRSALGLDMPLYEGGFKTTYAQMQKYQHRADELQFSQIENQQYAEVAKSYGALSLLLQQKQKTEDIYSFILKLQKNYRLGSKSNPLGYSGLLGLQSLSNRLQMILNQYQGQIETIYRALAELGVEVNAWSPALQTSSVEFVNRYMSIQGPSLPSPRLQSMQQSSLMAQKSVDLEKSKFLPRVGAFAETYNFSGDRKTANAYMAGLYLQWNLFNPADFGSVKESQIRSMSQEKNYAANLQLEKIESESLQHNISVTKEALGLLAENQKILTEQAQVGETLFKNGSINILQFLEILGRRADLISAQTDLSQNLLNSSAQLIAKSQFSISEVLSENN